MKELFEMLEKSAKQIDDFEMKKLKIGNILTDIDKKQKLFFPVEKVVLHDVKVAAVDGGMVKKSLYGFDILLLKAVGVIFSFKDNKLFSTEYFPDSLKTPNIDLTFDPLSELDFEMKANMKRLKEEVKTATELVEKFLPDFIFLHGSVVPHYADRPSKNSFIFSDFTEMIEAYKRLFEVAEKNNVVLAGIVEDSRGSRFCDVISEKIIKEANSDVKILFEKMKDILLLQYALKYANRTFVFKYSHDAKTHPVLREFREFADKIFSMYVNTASLDRAVRVDFFGNEKFADKLSSAILALCGHSGYGIPSVIIEADQRAKLSEKDMEMILLQLTSSGNIPAVFDLRRNLRPF